jgi:hypothetical protein
MSHKLNRLGDLFNKAKKMARFKLYTTKAVGGKKLKYESDNLDEVKNRLTAANQFIIDSKKGEQDGDKKISQ